LSGLGAFLAAPLHWRILVDLFGISLSGGIFVVPLYVLLQAASPRRERARAIAANNIVNAAAMVVAALATMALLAAGLGVPRLFLLTGGATIVVAAQFWRLSPSFAAVGIAIDSDTDS
jgi:hypothetical protein